MYKLIVSMIDKEPERRPSMEEATKELNKIISQLPTWTLRARLRARKDDGVINFLKDVQHMFRTAFYIALFLPPLPTRPVVTTKPERTGNFFSRTFHSLTSLTRVRRQNIAPPAS